MGIISNIYIKQFVGRYDKEVGVPYYSHLDFKGLKQESFKFTNSQGNEIHYFYYYYDKYNEGKIVLFLPGIGPGHTAYLKEIEWLAKNGYKVLTIDYTGCAESSGKYLASLNTPTRDVNELLDYLKLDKEIVLVGHSMGAFTSINILNLRKEITKGVIISGFLSVESLVTSLIKSKFISHSILKYERKQFPTYYDLNNFDYLTHTSDKLLFIHSKDDQMVHYDVSMKVVEQINNQNIETVVVDHRGHNPNYTEEAVKYMQQVFGEYNQLVKKKKIKTDEEKINYFKNVSLEKLVEQDEKIISRIIEFTK